MHHLSARRFAAVMCIINLLMVGIAQGLRVWAASSQPNNLSFWGMNLYLTKRERIGRDNLNLLADTARSGGVQWTREELPWAHIEPSRDDYRTLYDNSLKLTADKGFGIIGMLVTTPPWARDGSCQPRSGFEYFCPPANVHDFAEFARWTVERYDGDGTLDAPGSPRIAYWEIWNEPNYTKLWPRIGGGENAHKRRYGEMLVAAYSAIKAADPTARVLIGGMYIFDGGCWGVGGEPEPLCDGLNFLNASGGVFQQVPSARNAYDIFSIHPYISTDRPDATQIPPRITLEGRIRTTRAWLSDPNSGNRPDQPPIWITEIGWCTASSALCGQSWSEEHQANFLTRSMVIAQRSGAEHVSWFQFEDAFNDPSREYGTASIVNDYNGSAYAPKAAYYAYRTLVQQLDGATPAGTGPIHQHEYLATADFGRSDDVYDYRYTKSAGTIDVLWVPQGSQTRSFPVAGGQQVMVVDRDGTAQSVTPSGGFIQLTLTERPIYVIQGTTRLQVSQTQIGALVRPGTSPAPVTLRITNGGVGSFTWTASEDLPWITLSTTTGSAPGSITVTLDTRNLPAGIHTGTIRIAGTNGAGSVDIPVRVHVSNTIHEIYAPIVLR